MIDGLDEPTAYKRIISTPKGKKIGTVGYDGNRNYSPTKLRVNTPPPSTLAPPLQINDTAGMQKVRTTLNSHPRTKQSELPGHHKPSTGRKFQKKVFAAMRASGGFMVASDERQFAVQNYHITDGGRNVSAGVSAGGLSCLACVGAHPYSYSTAKCFHTGVFYAKKNNINQSVFFPLITSYCTAGIYLGLHEICNFF
jgi:hypothetical protein